MRRFALLCPALVCLACASPSSAPANEAAPAQHAPAAPQAGGGAAPEAAPEAEADGALAPSAQAKPSSDRFAEDKDQALPEEGGAARPGAPSPSPSTGGEGLELQVPMISGGLDRDIIRRVAKDRASDVRGCVPEALAHNPALSELLTIELSIDPKGSVSEAEVAEGSAFTLSEVERCVLELAKGWSFPAAENGEATELTLELGLGG